MAAISIKDLEHSSTLDRRAMASIRGAGGAPWVFGVSTPFESTGGRSGNVFNVVNQFFIARQISFQNQVTEVFNSGANAVVTVDTSQASANSQIR